MSIDIHVAYDTRCCFCKEDKGLIFVKYTYVIGDELCICKKCLEEALDTLKEVEDYHSDTKSVPDVVVITVTAKYLLERGLWDRACVIHGINPWAMAEGLMSSSDTLGFTQKQVEEMGLDI